MYSEKPNININYTGFNYGSSAPSYDNEYLNQSKKDALNKSVSSSSSTDQGKKGKKDKKKDNETYEYKAEFNVGNNFYNPNNQSMSNTTTVNRQVVNYQVNESTYYNQIDNSGNNVNMNLNNNSNYHINNQSSGYNIENKLENQGDSHNHNDDPDEDEIKAPALKSSALINAKIAYPICITLAVLSLLLTILGIILKAKTVGSISSFLIAFGFISMLVFLFGIWAIWQYANYVRNYGEEKADQSSEREFFNLFIYMTIIVLLAFLIIGVSCIVYKDEARSYITALGQNSEKWNKTFGNIKYADMQKYLSTMMIVIIVFSAIMIMVIAALLVCLYFMLDEYRFMQTLVQFFCLIFFTIGAILLYVAMYADRYRDIANMNDSMPSWVPTSLLACSILTILIAVLGYFAMQQENKNITLIFFGITGLFTLFILAGSIFAILYSKKFEVIFNGKCKSILEMVPQNFLIENAGCSRKYVIVSTDLTEISSCPKERIIDAWDVKFDLIKKTGKAQETHYGCYDSLCCTSTYNTIKSKSNYLALIAVFLFIVGLMCAIGSYRVYSDLDEGLQREAKSKTIFSKSNIMIIFLVLVVAAVIIYAIATLPNKPIQNPDIVPIKPSPNNKVPSVLVIETNLTKVTSNQTNEIKNGMKNETKVEEKKDCGSKCPTLRYVFQMSSYDGIFNKNKTADWKNLIIKQDGKEGDKYIVEFEGDSQYLNSFTQYYEFVHKCPILPSSIDIKISGEVNPPITSFIEMKSKSKKLIKELQSPGASIVTKNTENSITSQISTNIIDYSKLKVGDKFDVLNKNIDYSFVYRDKFQIITGQVLQRVDLKTSIPVKNAVVEIKSLEFDQCNSEKISTDDNGRFSSSKLYIFNNYLKTKFSITVTATGLTTYKNTVIVGGIGAPDMIDLGKIELWSPSMLEPTNISANVLDSLNNMPLSDVKVSLYLGYTKFNNQAIETKSSLVPSFVELTSKSQQNSVFKSTSTYDNGLYEFKDISPNQYTILFEKDGYYTESFEIEIIGRMTKPLKSMALTPYVENGKIRVVLSWPDAPSDLDLYSIFRTGPTTKCQVFFGKKVCSGTSLDVDNNLGGRKGAETITIDLLENYIYTFAVRKYVDLSFDGLAPGESRVEGAPRNGDYDYVNNANSDKPEILPNITLSESAAKISVFVNGYKSSIQEIKVPSSMAPEYLLYPSDKDDKYNDWWLAFCLDGNQGLTSIKYVNKLTSKNPDYGYCENLYGKNYDNNNTNSTSFVELENKERLRKSSMRKMKKIANRS